MDLSGLSDADVDALANGDMSKVSDEGLDHISNGGLHPGMGPALQAGMEHFGNAAAQGYLPHLQAMAEPVTDRMFNAATGQNVEPAPLKQALAMGPGYVQSRDANIARLKKEQQQNPTASTVGTVGGALTSSIPMAAGLSKLPGMAALAGMSAPEGASLAARGAALGGRTAASTLSAGAQGLITNPGDTEGEVNPLQIEDRLKGAGLNAAVAAPLHLGGEAVSAAGDWLAPNLKDKAEKIAFRALGPYKRQVNQNRDEINDIGREALDSGVIGWKPTGAEGIEERAQEAAGQAGKKLGDITDELIGLEGQAHSSGMSREQIADNLKKKLIIENESGIPAIDKRNTFYNGMIQDFEKDPTITKFSQDPMIQKMAAQEGTDPYTMAQKLAQASGYKQAPMSFADLRNAKMAVQGTKDQEGLINWNRLKSADIPPEEQFHRALAGELRQGEESGAQAIEKAYYGDASNRFSDAKDKFGNLEEAAKIAGNRADAYRANHILGLRDAVLAAGGASAGATIGGYAGDKIGGHEGAKAGAVLGGIIGGGSSKLAREYGSQVAAKMTDKMANFVAQSPQIQAVIQKYPNVLPDLIHQMEGPNNKASGSGSQIADLLNRYQQSKQGSPNSGDIKQLLEKYDQSKSTAPIHDQMPMELDDARQLFREGN